MDLNNIINILDFILVLLGTIFIPSKVCKWIIIIIGIVILIFNNYILKKEKKGRKEINYKINALNYELQRQRLINRGIYERYINGLGRNPLFQYAYQAGQEYERKGNYEEAIKNYKEILENPLADEENRVAAYNQIGLCHFALSEFENAKQNYQMALNIVKKVKTKEERLISKAVMLNNIGLIYRVLWQFKKAIKYHKNALRLHLKLDNKLGRANTLFNIYIGYLFLNKPRKALEKIKEAIEVYQEALKVYTLDRFPLPHALIKTNLKVVYSLLTDVQDKVKN